MPFVTLSALIVLPMSVEEGNSPQAIEDNASVINKLALVEELQKYERISIYPLASM